MSVSRGRFGTARVERLGLCLVRMQRWLVARPLQLVRCVEKKLGGKWDGVHFATVVHASWFLCIPILDDNLMAPPSPFSYKIVRRNVCHSFRSTSVATMCRTTTLMLSSRNLGVPTACGICPETGELQVVASDVRSRGGLRASLAAVGRVQVLGHDIRPRSQGLLSPMNGNVSHTHNLLDPLT